MLVTNNSGAACAAPLQTVHFSAKSDSQEDYPELQPRFGATYAVNRNNVIRFSAGKYAQPASSAFQQYDTVQPNLLPANTVFYPIGFRSPSHVGAATPSFARTSIRSKRRPRPSARCAA